MEKQHIYIYRIRFEFFFCLQEFNNLTTPTIINKNKNKKENRNGYPKIIIIIIIIIIITDVIRNKTRRM